MKKFTSVLTAISLVAVVAMAFAPAANAARRRVSSALGRALILTAAT